MHPLPPPRRQGHSFSYGESYGESHDPPETSDANASGPQQSRGASQGRVQSQSNTLDPSSAVENAVRKRRKHRGGKRKKNRRQSFAAPSETSTMPETGEAGIMGDPLIEESSNTAVSRQSFYRRGGNLSDASLDSEVLLDHRDQPMMRPRRESRAGLFPSTQRASTTASLGTPQQENGPHPRRSTIRKRTESARGEEQDETNDRTPLLGSSNARRSPQEGFSFFKSSSRRRRASSSTSSGHNRRQELSRNHSFPPLEEEYDVNNPPSRPPSPRLDENGGVDDVMVSGGQFLGHSPDSRRNLHAGNQDTLVDIDGDGGLGDLVGNSAPPSPRLHPDGVQRRRTIQIPTQTDVCLPNEVMSELGDEDFDHLDHPTTAESHRPRRRRRGFPQLWVLDEWSRAEKEERLGEIRAKKVAEPVLVEGRLRPSKAGWHREEEDVPYRYTYFNEDRENTIHAQTISELVQPGETFRDLFIPDPIQVSDTESDSEEEKTSETKEKAASIKSPTPEKHENTPLASRLNSMLGDTKPSSRDPSSGASKQDSKEVSGVATPAKLSSPMATPTKEKRVGRRPAFWLDVMCPTAQEMQVLCKTFGIHALTSEDIMLQEAREKVELFRHYYFINYRTFEQDSSAEEYLEALNVYVIVFHGGVITFHWTQIPHPANVRRRIRQLTDYLELSPDWIAYGIIDDITDVYQPLINTCENEVDEIDEEIIHLFQQTQELSVKVDNSEKASIKSGASDSSKKGSGIDLLLRIGESRKKVMSLYRLLGTKADVIKGFAKRCNEQWEVAPKSEIGLYLGDIQDHILTMTSNLSHYESLLSRAHANYLAQVSIRMNERQEQTADILGKLTVVGTIVLPMNIICGMWGMNVTVPGQDTGSLVWFWSITAGLLMFAIVCFIWARKVYGLV